MMEKLEKRIGRENVRRIKLAILTPAAFFAISLGIIGVNQVDSNSTSANIAIRAPNGTGIYYLTQEQYDLIPDEQKPKYSLENGK
jgi:hypothetical protein